MPYTLKTQQISVKDPDTGEYSGVDILTEQTEQGLIAEIQAEGEVQIARIEQAGIDASDAIDQMSDEVQEIIAETQAAINDFDSQKNTIAAAVASMANLGTDTTFSTAGMAADAKATGAVKAALADVEGEVFKEVSETKTLTALGKLASKEVNSTGIGSASSTYYVHGYLLKNISQFKITPSALSSASQYYAFFDASTLAACDSSTMIGTPVNFPSNNVEITVDVPTRNCMFVVSGGSISPSGTTTNTFVSRVDELTSEISALEADEYIITEGKNKFPNNPSWINATFSNGVISPLDTGKNNTVEEEFIEVSAEEAWTISWKAKDLNCTMYVVCYDESKAYLSGFTGAAMNAVTRSATFTMPENCAYIRIRIYRSGANYTEIIPEEVQVEKGSQATSYEPKTDSKIPRVDLIDAEIEAINSEIGSIQEELENEPTREVVSDKNLLGTLIAGYLKDDGTFNTTTSGWYRSDYIPVEPGQFVYFYNINNWSYFGYFNSEKTWIGGKNIETPVVTDSNYLCIHQVPANAAYMIVSLEDSKAATCWGNHTPTIPTGDVTKANLSILRSYEFFPTNPCDYEGMDVCVFRKGLCIGDSLTAGGFNYNSGTNPWSDGNIYSYPAQFQKMTGIEMVNEGHSGRDSVQWWANYGTGGQSEIDFSGYDFAIIGLGVNDVSHSVSTEDSEEAFQNIIDALKTANNGIKIFVFTILPAYADVLIAESAYGDINEMIAGLSEQENVYLCDLTTYGHEFTNSPYAAGHLTAYGYWRLAKDLMGYIGSIMQKYPWDFRFVQFIGSDAEY